MAVSSRTFRERWNSRLETDYEKKVTEWNFEMKIMIMDMEVRKNIILEKSVEEIL